MSGNLDLNPQTLKKLKKNLVTKLNFNHQTCKKCYYHDATIY